MDCDCCCDECETRLSKDCLPRSEFLRKTLGPGGARAGWAWNGSPLVVVVLAKPPMPAEIGGAPELVPGRGREEEAVLLVLAAVVVAALGLLKKEKLKPRPVGVGGTFAAPGPGAGAGAIAGAEALDRLLVLCMAERC